MKPTIGRTVHYVLSEDDAKAINRRRKMDDTDWLKGAQRHSGNMAYPRDVVPMVITHVSSDTVVNGQAFLDGNDSLWVTSAKRVEFGSGE